MLRLSLVMSAAALVSSCAKPTAPAPTSAPSLDALQTRSERLGELLDAKAYDLVAAGIREGPALAVSDVLAEPSRYVGAPLRVAGAIVAVCQSKGCWMRIGTADRNLLIKFGACDRYVPTNAAGREALVEGQLQIAEVSVEEQRHLLEDSGDQVAAALVTAPKREAHLRATGAAIRR